MPRTKSQAKRKAYEMLNARLTSEGKRPISSVPSTPPIGADASPVDSLSSPLPSVNVPPPPPSVAPAPRRSARQSATKGAPVASSSHGCGSLPVRAPSPPRENSTLPTSGEGVPAAGEIPGGGSSSSPQVNSDSAHTPVSHQFFSEASVANWEFVKNQSVICEKTLDMKSAARSGIVDLIRTEGLLGSVSYASSYSLELVREFYANLTADVLDTTSPMYHKVYLRGELMDFSPALINDLLETSNHDSGRDREVEGRWI